jgi:hypothetical protein
MQSENNAFLDASYTQIVSFTKKHRIPISDITIMYNWVKEGAFSDLNIPSKLPIIPLEILEKIFYHAHAGLLLAQCTVERVFLHYGD